MNETCETCPECGRELIRNEDRYGVTYQCVGHDCLAYFEREEIERGEHSQNKGEKA